MFHALVLLLSFLFFVTSHILTGSELDAEGVESPRSRHRNASVLILVGSLRRLSSNAGIARAAAACSPQMVLAPRLDSLPYFDADIESPLPHSVAALRALAFSADGFWFQTPEYNGATSAVLKNAIDWLSRSGPEGVSPLKGKLYSVASAGGGGGGSRGQANIAAVVRDSEMVRVGGLEQEPLAIKLWDGTKRFSAETGDLEHTGTIERVCALAHELLQAASEGAQGFGA